MNVLQVVPELRVGGVERGTVDLAARLVAAGHKAVVISNGGELVKELTAAGALHYQLPVDKKSLWNICAMIPRIAQIIRKEKIDIVHARSRAPAWSAFLQAAAQDVFSLRPATAITGNIFSVIAWDGANVL